LIRTAYAASASPGSRRSSWYIPQPIISPGSTIPATQLIVDLSWLLLMTRGALGRLLLVVVVAAKIASKLIRTYTDRHGLKDVLRETIGVDVSKAQQSSDWGAAALSEAQKDYAASDVRYLHRAQLVLAERLAREGRTEMAQACFDFLPWRAELDLAGWPESDIFAHM